MSRTIKVSEAQQHVLSYAVSAGLNYLHVVDRKSDSRSIKALVSKGILEPMCAKGYAPHYQIADHAIGLARICKLERVTNRVNRPDE